jgi:hypothetical protein
MQNDKLKNYLHLHFLVLIAGFTAILGELITIDAIPLVWYRMTIAGVLMFLFIKFKKMSLKVPLKGTMLFHFNEDTNGSIIDCFQSSSDNFSYTNSEDSFTQFVFTLESGGQLIVELSDDRNNLTFNGNNTQAIYTFTRE